MRGFEVIFRIPQKINLGSSHTPVIFKVTVMVIGGAQRYFSSFTLFRRFQDTLISEGPIKRTSCGAGNCWCGTLATEKGAMELGQYWMWLLATLQTVRSTFGSEECGAANIHE